MVLAATQTPVPTPQPPQVLHPHTTYLCWLKHALWVPHAWASENWGNRQCCGNGLRTAATSPTAQCKKSLAKASKPHKHAQLESRNKLGEALLAAQHMQWRNMRSQSITWQRNTPFYCDIKLVAQGAVILWKPAQPFSALVSTSNVPLHNLWGCCGVAAGVPQQSANLGLVFPTLPRALS